MDSEKPFHLVSGPAWPYVSQLTDKTVVPTRQRLVSFTKLYTL